MGISIDENAFCLAITSDPQYPWYDGVFPTGIDRSDEDRVKENSNRQITQRYESINDVAQDRKNNNGRFQVAGVIINGDLTDYGHGWQLDKYKEQVAIISSDITYYPSLGNHDYSNNVDDTANNGAASQMVHYMYDWLQSMSYKVSYDFGENSYYKFPEFRTDYTGSLAYSFNIGKVHIVQLQNFPSYSDEWNRWNGGSARRDFYFIRPSFYWLRNDLAVARNRGDIIIVFLHDYHDSFVADLERFENIMAEYNVSAVFAGHVHKNCGYMGTVGNTGIQFFRSGAASYQDYLLADIDVVAASMLVTKMACPEDGDYGPGESWTVPLDARVPSPLLNVPPTEGWVTFKNSGGFEARFRLIYTNDQGETIEESTGTMRKGEEKTFYISPYATSVYVTAWENTGLVWEGWRNVFDINLSGPPNIGYRLTGTTLNPHWDNDT